MPFQRRQLVQILSYAFGQSFLSSRNESAMAAQSAVSPASPVKQEPETTETEKVVGIGGLFFRAHDPAAVAQWYLQHLGISLTPTSYGAPVWQQEAGPTVFTPFPEKTKYFGDAQKMWMVNFRVRNLDKLAAQLQAAGIEVKLDPQVYPNGRFAHLHDLEGNPIELWEPSKANAPQ